MSDVMNALARLRKRVQDTTRKHGLDEQFTYVLPSDRDDGSSQLVIIVTASDGFDASTTEVDPEFEKVLEEAAKAEQERKASEAAEKLQDFQKRLDEGGGFLS